MDFYSNLPAPILSSLCERRFRFPIQSQHDQSQKLRKVKAREIFLFFFPPINYNRRSSFFHHKFTIFFIHKNYSSIDYIYNYSSNYGTLRSSIDLYLVEKSLGGIRFLDVSSRKAKRRENLSNIQRERSPPSRTF